MLHDIGKRVAMRKRERVSFVKLYNAVGDSFSDDAARRQEEVNDRVYFLRLPEF
jgi:hypothetical protein